MTEGATTRGGPRARWTLAVAAAVVAALLAHAAYYYPFFSDDALISLRYAARLCAGQGLTWTEGERVEGYTDLLWVLLNAPAACVGLEPIWSARVLDVLGCALAALVIGVSPSRAGLSVARLASGSTFFVLSGPVAAWAVGGLEQGFMTGVLAVALYYARSGDAGARTMAKASLCFGMLALLRADGVVLFAGATLGRVLLRDGRRGGVRGALVWFAFPVAFLVAQTAFRLGYYGEWVPNTAIVKVSFSLHRLKEGILHVGAGLIPLSVVGGAALGSSALGIRQRRVLETLVPLCTAVTWLAYVASVGGDIFPGWRQVLLAWVPLSMLLADGVEAIWGRVKGRALASTALSMAVALALHVFLQFRDPENVRAKHELWEWDGLPIGTALGRAFGDEKPLLAVDAAGALPYWSGLPALDMLGLNDHYIPRHPPPGFGLGGIGHELGDAEYTLRRRPDLIAFCGAIGHPAPCFIGGRGMFSMNEFRSAYQVVRLQGDPRGPIGHIYFLREGGRLGVRRSPDRIVVPGYLLAQGPAVARLDGDELVTDLRPRADAFIQALQVEAGTWEITTRPAAALDVAFACHGVSPNVVAGGRRGRVRLEVEAPLDVVIATKDSGGPVLLRELVLQRVDDAEAGWVCGPRTRSTPTTRALADLAEAPDEGSFWASPDRVRFGHAGLRVALARVYHPTAVEMSADGNDAYHLHFFLGDVLVGRAVAPVATQPGMQTRVVEAPPDVTQRGCDSIAVRPGSGDGAYSVGHLTLVE